MTNPIDVVQGAYNKYTQVPSISYNVLSYLFDHNDLIFRLLAYPAADAWNRANLTKSEKAALVYNGGPNMTSSRIFLNSSVDDAWKEEACQLRISPIEWLPTVHTYGAVAVAFEVYTHSKIDHMDNYTTRTDVMIQQLLETLNGADISGVGRLFFDARASNRCKVVVIGSLPYRGKALIMVNHSLG